MTQGGNRRSLVAERRSPAPKLEPERRPRRSKPARKAPKGNFLTRFILGTLGFVIRMIWGVVWRLTAVVTTLMAAATLYFYVQLPELNALLDGRARGSVTMIDTNGATYAWRGENYGGIITSEQVSHYLRDAVVATEDRRFWWHFGVSPRGIVGAIMGNMAAGRSPFSGAGGSTITQQVAKLLCLGRPYDPAVWASEAEYEADCREGTLWRKIQELPYAFALELRYSKPEILTIYLNRAFLGAGSRGFEAAAQRYFGRSASEIGPAESAMLAGLLQRPSYFAPTRNLARAQERAATVVRLMQEQGYLTATEVQEALQFPATLSRAAESSTGGWFADWVMQSGPAWLTRDTTEDVTIRTTLDPRVQRAAEEALSAVFAERVRDGSTAEAAIVVMSSDGAVRAMVGGRNYTVTGGFNRATQARRQTGSAFKPFVFALAMDLGYNPYDMVDDSPLTLNIPGSGAWSPRNYTNDFRGMMTIAEAFARSQNIPAVRISEAMGRAEVRRAANRFGLNSQLAEGPALALGASDATLLEMTAAYAGILNGGSAVRPYGFTELRLAGEAEPLMGISGGIGERVISEPAALQLTWMMSQVLDAPYGTGRRARLPDGRAAAGKTGTTQDARDAWFVGFTADYVVGVWMGNDDYNVPLTGVTGGGLPADIWRETMVRIHEGMPRRPLPMIVPERPRLEPPVAPAPVQPMSEPPSLGDSIRGILGDILGGN